MHNLENPVFKMEMPQIRSYFLKLHIIKKAERLTEDGFYNTTPCILTSKPNFWTVSTPDPFLSH